LVFILSCKVLTLKKSKRLWKNYLQLVDRFCEENKYYLAPQQYEAAKEDFEYFMRLIKLAAEYHKEG